MARIGEINSLFAALALNLRPLDPAAGIQDHNVHHSISSLNCSLNICEVPGVRVLNTALSLMCFTSPQVFDSMIEQTIGTIVTVLSSSIECNVFTSNGNQALRAGGSISKRNCENVLESCVNILSKIEGDVCIMLLYAVVRMVALAPALPSSVSSTLIREKKYCCGKSYDLTELICHIPDEFSVRSHEIPLQLLLWHLDPLILKQDVSKILQEFIKRPFLCLRSEIYERLEWRSKVTCLVFSPSIFVEARALLHNWFLETGMASVLELQTEFVTQMLDIISRPMWWGISMEVGTNLPFSQAYFPYEQSFLRTLAGPISEDHLRYLLTQICCPVSPYRGNSKQSSKKTGTKTIMMGHKSMWSIAINFPGWFFFASVLLFYNKCHSDILPSEVFSTSAKPLLLHDEELSCSAGAARFIAWILNPISQSYQKFLVNRLAKASGRWTFRCFSSNKAGHKQEIKRLKLHDYKHGMNSQCQDSLTVSRWLDEFNDAFNNYLESQIPKNGDRGCDIQQSLLFRRIPLGILIACPNLSPAGCAMLLNYAITGNVYSSLETKDSGQKRRWKCDYGSFTWIEEYTMREAISACRIVFDITDVTETVSSSIFENKEEGMELVGHMKSKIGDYLFNCMRRLVFQLEVGDGSLQLKHDLLKRVAKWRNQGKDVFQNNKDLNFVCEALTA